jgi:hypothetical protein
MAFKSKADQAFEMRLAHELEPQVYLHGWGPDEKRTGLWTLIYKRYSELSVDMIENLFNQYGGYLELIGQDVPIGATRVFTFNPYRMPSKELILVGHNEPTVIEEQLHVLSGGKAALDAQFDDGIPF